MNEERETRAKNNGEQLQKIERVILTDFKNNRGRNVEKHTHYNGQNDVEINMYESNRTPTKEQSKWCDKCKNP